MRKFSVYRLLAGAVLTAVLFMPPLASAQFNLEDLFELEVDGSTLTIHHDQARYNCCWTSMEYEISHVDFVLTVVENEIIDGPACACLCYYDLTVEVTDLPAGEWLLEFWWLDSGGWISVELPFAIEVPGQDPQLGAFVSSACYDGWTAVPEAEEEPVGTAWTAVKMLYR